MFPNKLPSTQYLGSKQKLVDWIIKHTPKCESIFDAFSGSAVVGYHFKKLGKRVICNDFLKSNYYYAKAFIENNNTKLSEEDIKFLLKENPNKLDYIEKHFANIFYTTRECEFLDNLYANISEIENEYKKALAFAAAIRTCVQKMPGGKFRSNLFKYRDRNFPHYRPKFSRDIKLTFKIFLYGYNSSVFDNKKENKAYNENIFDVLTKIKTDIVYFDPPYGGSGFNYEKDYFFLEVFTKYYGKKTKFYGKTRAYKNLQNSGFTEIKGLEKSFNRLFKSANHIPIWVISYNNRSIPEYNKFVNLIKKFKNIKTVYEKSYHYKIGNSKGVKEILFICN